MRPYLFLFGLLLLPVLCFAQYPNFPSKITLGLQTTGDGLIYRGAGAPAYTPANNRNAWVYLDTVASSMYVFTGGVWKTTGGGADSTLASNGLNLSGKTVKLGGSLDENTTIAGGNYGLTVSTTEASTPGLTVSSPYIGLQASSTNGSTALYGITSNSSTTTVLNSISLLRNTSGTAGNGIGQSIALAHETNSGISYTGNEIKSLWSNATTASRTSRFIISGVNSGTLADKFTIEGDGQIKLNAYGTNNQIGTGWGRLVAQADGTVAVDTTTISGGGVTVTSTTLETSPITGVVGKITLVDCSAAARTVAPPSSPTLNQRFAVSDARAASAINNITVDFVTASQPLYGASQNYIINANGGLVEFIYVDATTGWIATKG